MPRPNGFRRSACQIVGMRSQNDFRKIRLDGGGDTIEKINVRTALAAFALGDGLKVRSLAMRVVFVIMLDFVHFGWGHGI